jgi:molybdopterin-guanine dinucleotide biosynthesis protein A
MISKEKITGIVLAGGNSRRFGSDKGLHPFKGRPLVKYSVEVLKPLCGKILVSANNNIDRYKEMGYEVVQDSVKGIGPLGGILSCLKYSETQHNLVLSCDMPFMNSSVFELLVNSIENFQAVVPVHETFLFEPLSAYYNTNVLGDLQKSIGAGDYKVMNFLKKVRFKPVLFDKKISWYSDNVFTNINRLADLEAFEKQS